ncbi:ABC transporter substrate-binding protein [Candidatus Halobonum tyrrellensis]|uniref:ABC-type sugar transport system, periplasmic component n=1 Tax=Candidatus Halobonum tyrrellensis G22 TaxID=1324957 RepID=V4GX82_9EURY|nr:ABC transporter substrate-binding protein [Candidatus Halobonum tyrrellensis]ESP89781.1 ABC-type sugar transport system, periplasmic component [Candidatus Halobonum tyrrellensis G22]
MKSLGVGTALGLAGCSGGGGGSSEGADTDTTAGGESTAADGSSGTDSGSGETTTLNVASWGEGLEREIVEEILTNYESSKQGVEVDYQNTPNEQYSQNLQTQFAGGEEPDVFYLIADEAPTFMRNSALLGIGSDLRDAEEYDFEDLLDNLVEPFTYEGTVYGVPKDFTPVGLFYNSDHLDAAGVSAPTTWSELRSVLEAIAESTDVDYPMAVGSQPRNTLLALVWQNGGDVLSEDGSEAVIGSPEAVEAMEFLDGLVEDDLAGIYGNDIDATWAPPAMGPGTISMSMTGAWSVSTLEQDYADVYEATEVGLPIPEGGEEATISFTTAWAASANTDAPDASVELIQSLTNAEGMWEWVSTGTALPARQSLLERDFYDDRPLLSGLGDLAEVAHPMVFGPQTSTILDIIMNEAEAVLTGSKSPETAMTNAERQINSEL